MTPIIVLLDAEYCAECQKYALYAECRCAECPYDECRYAECRYAECHHAECLDAQLVTILQSLAIVSEK